MYTRYLQFIVTQCNRTREKRFIFRRETCDPPFTYVSVGKKVCSSLPPLYTPTVDRRSPRLLDGLFVVGFSANKAPPPPRLTLPLSAPRPTHTYSRSVPRALSLSPWVNPFVGGEGGSRGVGGRLPRFATYRYLRQKKPSRFFSVMFCVLLGDEMREKMCLFVSPSSPSHGGPRGGKRAFPNAPPKKSSSRQLFSHICMRVCIRIYPFPLLSHLSCHSWQRQKGSLLLPLLFSLLFSLFGPKTKRGGIHHRSRGYSGFGKDTFLC